MSIHVALNHVTRYRYDRLVALSPQVIRLRPAAHTRTPILAYSLRVTPAEHFINWQQDPHGNYLARLNFPDKTRELRVEVDLVAELSVINPFDFFAEPYATQFPFSYEAGLREELLPYLGRTAPSAPLKDFLATLPRETMGSVDFLVDVNRRVQRAVGYVIRLEPGVQTPEQTLALGSGSCRDSAWLLVEVLRQLGLAARFVSGYLIQLVADVKPLDGPGGAEADFTDLHAWCEVYLPGAGWIGLDPTSGLFAGEGHIPLACSPQPSSASPVTGYSEKCECAFTHTMRVERIWEAPRVTRPYSDAQWAAIDALGQRIDGDLERGDVRLTMGGEPTFVASDDPDAAEWNSDALGPTKRLFAADVFHRLREKYAPHGLAHFGQGKWYPGEQLPRWSLNCYWRRDGQAIWNDTALCADEKVDYGADAELAGRFLRTLAAKLGLPSERVFPAYEDTFYYLWREQRLPINVDPLDARLDDAQERERLARVFGQGLAQVVGHVLPVMRHPTEPTRWQTSPWFLRGEYCRLVPGDSPMGYRLPLAAQPWVDKNAYPCTHAPDPTQRFVPLPAHAELAARLPLPPGMTATGQDRPPPLDHSAEGITRTALCVEPRDGRLYVFMPPTGGLDDYLELVAAVEASAHELKTPVLIEGYEPPADPRLTGFRVTPDPGVIEINVEPCASWNELVERTTHLYEAARQSRLSAEKFMLDGRHTGTGGGNHLVFGGKTPLDSPFLRRPDLLRSLIGYWHNHPSLSYLFSGLFIGPTSQAPRIDEARNDSVYELELAFAQFPQAGQSVAPWLIDRLLRNLLIDASGNTHRTEFCIDKLYSPDSASGRLGLLEMRAFEMPPHARMSLVQQLLLRALIARFWHAPYVPARLVRWGTELHDRFMLPHFIRQDFADVIDELRAAGYPIELDWFAPHFEFRFPVLGSFVAREMRCELRQALEPWHVMGEQGATGGTVRYVDASCERLEVKVSGMAGERYVLTCNGIPVPLRPTGKAGASGEYVAGVRYRAWRLPSALHPTIDIDAPLTFDLVDTWMQRSMGGCRYHVEHPGGRNPEHHPVNANEAEGRRLARFSAFGHTPGKISVPPAVANESFPFTLDLRRF